MTNDTSAYEYEGIPLTPNVFAALAPRVAPGELIRRKDLIDRVVAFHAASGGEQSGADIVGMSKKALQRMQELGTAQAAGSYGLYRIAGSEADAESIELVDDDTDLETDGSSTQYLYAYYLPAYKALADATGADRWPHKIGMTTTTPEARINSQVGTAIPEKPVIAIEQQTSDAATLEKAVHAILTLRDRKVADSIGSEWFTTNATEIQEIISFIG